MKERAVAKKKKKITKPALTLNLVWMIFSVPFLKVVSMTPKYN